MKSLEKPNIALSYVFSIVNLLLITPIFIEAFGPLLLYTKSDLYKNESKLLFYIVTVCGQTIFPIFSSINSGIFVIPMFELYESSSIILNSFSGSSGALKILLFVFQ